MHKQIRADGDTRSAVLQEDIHKVNRLTSETKFTHQKGWEKVFEMLVAFKDRLLIGMCPAAGQTSYQALFYAA